jgi:hypothetical protein
MTRTRAGALRSTILSLGAPILIVLAMVFIAGCGRNPLGKNPGGISPSRVEEYVRKVDELVAMARGDPQGKKDYRGSIAVEARSGAKSESPTVPAVHTTDGIGLGYIIRPGGSGKYHIVAVYRKSGLPTDLACHLACLISMRAGLSIHGSLFHGESGAYTALWEVAEADTGMVSERHATAARMPASLAYRAAADSCVRVTIQTNRRK